MNKENDILNSIKKKGSGFTLPEDYMANFEVHLGQKKLESKTGFSMPKEYLEAFDDKIISKVLNTSSTGFKFSDNYFDAIGIEILNKVNLNKKYKLISIIQSPVFKRISYAIAASLVLFFGVKSFYFTNNISDFDSLTATQIERWIDEELVLYNTYEIADSYNFANFSLENNYSDEEILYYLDNTDIENLILKE